jgi:hypothetical protein
MLIDQLSPMALMGYKNGLGSLPDELDNNLYNHKELQRIK